MFRRFLSVLLALCMFMSMSSVAFASNLVLSSMESTECASTNVQIPHGTFPGSESNGIVPYGGTETWSGSTGYVGSFTMYGNNLTPVKTIGRSGYLSLSINYGATNGKPIKLTVQFLDANTDTVISQTTMSTYNSEDVGFTLYFPVKVGDKIQVFFRVTDMNGKYDDNRGCHISYSYNIQKN